MSLRDIWLDSMIRICEPVLFHMSQGTLKEAMPVETKGKVEDRQKYTYLEALGRTLMGMAPWLSHPVSDFEEEQKRQFYLQLAVKSIRNAVNPQSPDYVNFSNGGQPLVDAAFLAQAILRAPKVLFEDLDEPTKKNLIKAMKDTRVIRAPRCNWLWFSACVEAFLHMAKEPDWDRNRIDYALFAHEEWYKGDGVYGDGPEFHFDYYNSFVIQPMMLDVLREVQGEDVSWQNFYPVALKRSRHFATILEHLISPEGTYPLVGRSLTYRFGAFQTLSQMVLFHELEPQLTAPGVRCALTAVLQNTMKFPSMFDEDGWLRVGVLGSQIDMGETYISTGSLYLCSAFFLPLGLPRNDPFWFEPDEDWTMKKLWNGENLPCEHALKD